MTEAAIAKLEAKRVSIKKSIILFWSAMKKMIVWWFPFQFFFWFEAAMPWRLKIWGRAIASTIFGRMTSKFHKIILWQWQISFINSFCLLHWFCEILEASLFKDSCVSFWWTLVISCKNDEKSNFYENWSTCNLFISKER